MKEWIEGAINSYFNGMKQRALENVDVLVEHLINALDEMSYVLALYGGAACVIAKICGSTRAKKYFFAFQIAHVFVKGLL